MDDLVLVGPIDLDEEVAALATRYAKAGGFGIELLNALGTQADGLLDRLPQKVQDGLTDATVQALGAAMQLAHKSRNVVPDQAGWLNTAVSTAMGAAGGLGGLPTALADCLLYTSPSPRD